MIHSRVSTKPLLDITGTFPYSFLSRRVDRDPACRGRCCPCWQGSVCRLRAGSCCSPASRNRRKTVPLVCWIVRTGDSSETRKARGLFRAYEWPLIPCVLRTAKCVTRRFTRERNESTRNGDASSPGERLRERRRLAFSLGFRNAKGEPHGATHSDGVRWNSSA